MNDAKILSPQQALAEYGSVLSLNNLRPHLGVHQNALLRKYEWEQIDAAVLDVVRTSLVGIQDLVSLGLVRPLGGLGTLISTYEQLGDMSAADISMEGIVDGTKDRVTFTPQSVPVPIIHKDFTLSLRHLEASRKMGEALDTTQVRVAARKVRDQMESMLFNGTTKNLGGYSIYGYTTAPHRLTDTAANYGGGDWGTAKNAYKTIAGMMTALNAKGFNGPFGCYAARTQFGQTLNTFGTTSDRSEYTVITQNIPGLSFLKASDQLTDGSVVLVQLTSDVVDLAIGQDVTAIQWAEMGGMLTQYRVMAALAPRIKFDSNNSCGVCHATSC